MEAADFQACQAQAPEAKVVASQAPSPPFLTEQMGLKLRPTSRISHSTPKKTSPGATHQQTVTSLSESTTELKIGRIRLRDKVRPAAVDLETPIREVEVLHREELVLEARMVFRRMMGRRKVKERDRSLGIGSMERSVVEVSQLRRRS